MKWYKANKETRIYCSLSELWSLLISWLVRESLINGIPYIRLNLGLYIQTPKFGLTIDTPLNQG